MIDNKQLQEHLEKLELFEKRDIQRIEAEIKKLKSLKKSIQMLRTDNERLCQEHNIEYWEGMTQKDRNPTQSDLELEKLRAKVEAQRLVLNHYRAVLCGLDPEKPEPKKKGRPSIDDAQKDRIRQLRKAGWSIREIATEELCSPSVVHIICKDTTPNPQKSS